jgi:hypothetical protein
MGIVRRAVVFLVAAMTLGVVPSAQSLADVARKAEEERTKAKQDQPARVLTNKDLADVDGPRPAASGEERSAADGTAPPTPRVTDPIRDRPAELSVVHCPKSSSTGIRTERVVGINGNAVATTLEVVLRGDRQDQLPVNLVIRPVHDDSPRSDKPRELTLLFSFSPVFVGSFDFTPPHLVFVLDDGLASAATIAATVPGSLAGGISTVSIEPFELTDLARLGNATTASGRLFNVRFALMQEQICAIRDLSQRVRRRPSLLF